MDTRYNNHRITNTQTTFYKIVKKLSVLQSIGAVFIAGASINASAVAPIVNPVTVSGAQVYGGQNIAMSRSGRYIASPINSAIWVLDLKTQSSSPIVSPALSYSGYQFISPNGRYISYPSPTSPNLAQGVIYDRSGSVPSSYVPSSDEQRALSDNGLVATRNQHPLTSSTFTGLVRFNTKTQTQDEIIGLSAQNSHVDRLDWFSADGKIILFEYFDSVNFRTGFKIQNFNITPLQNQVTTFQPLNSNGTPIVIGANSVGSVVSGATTIALSSNGKYIAFTSYSGLDQNIWIASLQPNGTYTLATFNLKNLHVTVEDGISVSANGRFISFRGQLTAGHPELAAAQALGHQSYYRIFRYDTVNNEVATISVAKDGGPIRNRFNLNQPTLEIADVYPLTTISDDGSIIAFSTNADNMTSSMTNTQGIRKYYAYLSNGLAHNYQFVDMPNSETNYFFNPMTLVGNNTWEGTIRFNNPSSTFMFDAGGNLSTSPALGTPENDIRWGVGSTPGQLISNGNTIGVTGGAGLYKVTFNDQTLSYTVTKQTGDWQRTVVMVYGETQTGQDMFVRGGLDHQQAKLVLGKDCDANLTLCSMPIRHRNTFNTTTAPWKQGDTKLDWQGAETGQGAGAQGSPLDWTTNLWPTSWGAKKTVAIDGYGETPLNTWGQHYWLLDVDMDCSSSYNGWFEVKSFISNGPGWESNIAQAGTPWPSNNHFAKCGKMNVFKRGQSTPVVIDGAL